MGWDITYHPIAASEIKGIYFRALEDPSSTATLGARFGVDPFYIEQLEERLCEARGFGSDIHFDKGHAFYLAIVAGHLRPYHYVRGGALSFLADDEVVSKYLSDWRDLVPAAFQAAAHGNCLRENYAGGVFVDHPALQQLRSDYRVDAMLRKRMDDVFSHGRLAIFWSAVDDAIEKECGLLEATEVVEPNPMDLNASRCASNLFNCDREGALLYAASVQEQIAGMAEQSEAPPSGERPVAETKRKGWLARLLGR